MLMDNSGVTGRIISSGGEQSANTANAASQFEQLRPEDVAGSFDAMSTAVQFWRQISKRQM